MCKRIDRPVSLGLKGKRELKPSHIGRKCKMFKFKDSEENINKNWWNLKIRCPNDSVDIFE